jgi:hypothetical protein
MTPELWNFVAPMRSIAVFSLVSCSEFSVTTRVLQDASKVAEVDPSILGGFVDTVVHPTRAASSRDVIRRRAVIPILPTKAT